MPKFIDKTGMVFGQLTVLSRAESKGGYTYWNCKCSCGNEVIVRGDRLTSSKVDDKGNPSCGCLRIKHVNKTVSTNLIGQKIGKLTVLEKTEKRSSNGCIIWKCKCDCGNKKYLPTDQLKGKHPTQSCGCLQKEVASNFLKELQSTKQPKIGTYENDFYILDIELRPTNNNRNETWIYSKCPFCEKEKWFQLRYVRNGDTKSCGCIASSAGEKKVAKILSENNISFETEKVFSDLKYKNSLRFDFYLPEENYLIEFDGIQHYEPETFGNITKEQAVQNLKETQIRDNLKNQYCIQNNIPLIRIPYWRYNELTIDDLKLETTQYLIEE